MCSYPLHPASPRGRGAESNRTGRFEPLTAEAFDDGWATIDEPALPLRTSVTTETAKTILTRNDSPDVPFRWSINPYRGCEHGCVYCFARSSHAYVGLSPGLDFESKLFAKDNAAERLRAAFAKPGYVCEPISIGTNTDAYQPIERERRIMRALLEVFDEFRHPLTIVTKSALVLRDLDLLASLAAEELVRVYVSVTTLDRTLARRMEPRAAAPERRLHTIARLAEAGIPAGVFVAPVIPALNDSEMERVMEVAREAGATSANWLLLRLPREVLGLFEEWMAHHYPDKKAHTFALLRAMHGGKAYDSSYGVRNRGTGRHAEALRWRFTTAAKRLGLDAPGRALDVTRFRPPARGPQLDLFQASPDSR